MACRVEISHSTNVALCQTPPPSFALCCTRMALCALCCTSMTLFALYSNIMAFLNTHNHNIDIMQHDEDIEAVSPSHADTPPSTHMCTPSQSKVQNQPRRSQQFVLENRRHGAQDGVHWSVNGRFVDMRGDITLNLSIIGV